MMELFTITLWVPQTIHSANKNFIFLFRTDISAQFLWPRTAVFEIFAWSLSARRWSLLKLLRNRSKIRNWKIWKFWASSRFFGLLSGDGSEKSRQPKNFKSSGLELPLTDTGEDSKLVRRRKCPKVDTLFLLFFSAASERRLWLTAESKILAFTFERFRLYRLRFETFLKP